MEGMPFEDLGYPVDRWASMQKALRTSAAAEGLIVENRPKVSNTRRALKAGAWAQAELPDLFPAFHERIFVGYFDEGLDLGDVHVIDSRAASVGIKVNQCRSARSGWLGSRLVLYSGRCTSDGNHWNTNFRVQSKLSCLWCAARGRSSPSV